MPKKTFIIILAACIAVMPFLGFPSLWEDSFYTGAGSLVLILSIDWNFLKKKKTRPVRSRRMQQSMESDAYVESMPPKVPNGGMNQVN
jgi:hypothetical protein